MGNGTAVLNLDELTEVIDQNANGNADNVPISIENTEGYDLVEIYDDDEEINTPGDKSFIDQLVNDFEHRDAEFKASQQAWKEGEISGAEHFFVGETKKLMIIPDTVGNIGMRVLDLGWKGVETGATGLRWIASQAGVEDSIDGWSQDQADKLANWWKNSQAAQDGVLAAMETKEDYDKWGAENPNDKRLLEAVVDIPLFFIPWGKVVPKKGVTNTPFYTAAKEQKRLLGKQQIRQKYDELWKMLNFKDPINKVNQRRVTAEGRFTKMTTINYNQYEKEYMDELLKIGVSGYKNPTKNNEIMSNSLESWAKDLKRVLSKPKNQIPISWVQTKATLRTEIDKLLLNPMYQTKQQKETIEAQLKLLYRYLDEGNFKGTPQGIFELRQLFDKKNMKYKKGANLDGTIPINALDDATRVIRQTLNKIVGDKVPDAKVAESLKKQTYMYNGLDDILPSLKADGWSAIQRSWKNAGSLIGLKMDFNRIMAVTFGASAYGMASLGYTGLAVGTAVAAGIGAGVAIQTKTTKRALGMLLVAMDKAIKVGTNPNTVRALSYDRAIIKEMFERPIEKGEPEEGV